MYRIKFYKRTTYITSLSIVIGMIVFAVVSHEARYIAAPIFICLSLVVWLGVSLWDRDRLVPLFDIGFLCAAIIMLYTVYPLINYWVSGMNFGFMSDFRLRKYHITPSELGIFHFRHVLYLLSFVVVYFFARGSGKKISLQEVEVPGRKTIQAVFLLFFLLTAYFFVLRTVTGINYRTSYEADAFQNTVTSFANAPLILLQISAKLRSIYSVFMVAVLYIVIIKYDNKLWRALLIIWLVAEGINTFLLRGDRGYLFELFISALLLFHRLVKNLSFRFLLTAGFGMFIFFIFLGIYRGFGDINAMRMDLSQTAAGLMSGSSEFQAILGTSYDVYQMKLNGVHLPWMLYMNDFVSILPPQQLLPFVKLSGQGWYMQQIGLQDSGLGFMWGVITQSIIGLDWIEVILRGAVLGYILALLHKWYVKRQKGFLETVFYAYMCLQIYYTYRDTTFSFLNNIIWDMIPFLIMLRLVVGPSLFHIKSSKQRRVDFSSE